jgi:hypothetical protein
MEFACVRTSFALYQFMSLKFASRIILEPTVAIRIGVRDKKQGILPLCSVEIQTVHSRD